MESADRRKTVASGIGLIRSIPAPVWAFAFFSPLFTSCLSRFTVTCLRICSRFDALLVISLQLTNGEGDAATSDLRSRGEPLCGQAQGGIHYHATMETGPGSLLGGPDLLASLFLNGAMR